MKEKVSLRDSVSILASVVIAILALIRGAWLLPLLLAAFAVWGLWAVRARVFQQSRRSAEPDRALARALLYHVNYRVSGCLQAAYPNARWEWLLRDPAAFVAQGGTGRIRVYGVPDCDYADVTVSGNGKLRCALIHMEQMANAEPLPTERQDADPAVWYETQGREALAALMTDLESRGYSSLTLKEDGSICICPRTDGKEIRQGTLSDFPARSGWPGLARVLEEAGLSAAVGETGIAVTW